MAKQRGSSTRGKGERKGKKRASRSASLPEGSRGDWATGAESTIPAVDVRLDAADDKAGPELRLMSWGEGSKVPTSGRDVIIAGTDHDGLLHIRTFDTAGVRSETYEAMVGGALHLASADASGNVLSETPESSLPAAQAGAIPALKQQLPGLLPPHVLSNAERDQVLSSATLIIGRTHEVTRTLAGSEDWQSAKPAKPGACQPPVSDTEILLSDEADSAPTLAAYQVGRLLNCLKYHVFQRMLCLPWGAIRAERVADLLGRRGRPLISTPRGRDAIQRTIKSAGTDLSTFSEEYYDHIYNWVLDRHRPPDEDYPGTNDPPIEQLFANEERMFDALADTLTEELDHPSQLAFRLLSVAWRS